MNGESRSIGQSCKRRPIRSYISTGDDIKLRRTTLPWSWVVNTASLKLFQRHILTPSVRTQRLNISYRICPIGTDYRLPITDYLTDQALSIKRNLLLRNLLTGNVFIVSHELVDVAVWRNFNDAVCNGLGKLVIV